MEALEEVKLPDAELQSTAERSAVVLYNRRVEGLASLATDSADGSRAPFNSASFACPCRNVTVASTADERRYPATEKRAAVSRCMPTKSPAVMVEPERETPGTRAKAWANPTVMASRQLI